MGLRYLWLKPLQPGILPSPMFPVRSKLLAANVNLLLGRHGCCWLLLTAQLLREVVGNSHFLDGMKLSLQEIHVPLFVLNHAQKR